MLSRQQWTWMIVVCSFVMLFLAPVACGPSLKQKGEPCSADTECDSTQDLECRANRCRAKLVNDPPVAKAQFQPDTPKVGDRVTLDGSGSFDKEGEELLYSWVMKSKPKASKSNLRDAQKSIASFIPDVPGDYSFTLKVNDGKLSSKVVELTISVQDSPNEAPIANAGPDRNTGVGIAVELDGTGSFDPDNNKLTFEWSLRSRPNGSKAELTKANEAKPSLKPDVLGRYVIELVVADERGKKSIADTVTVIAMEGFTLVPTVSKVTPAEGLTGTTVKVVVTGTNFVKGAMVKLGDQQFKTTFVTDKELKASLLLGLAKVGKNELTIVNPSGKASKKGVSFTVKGVPVPCLTQLKPAQGYTGMKKLKIKILGCNFIKGISQVVFETTPLVTNVISDKEIEFELDLRNVAIGEYQIKVIHPGGRTSPSKSFRVLAPASPPILRVLNPPFSDTDQKLDFSVHGNGFEVGAVIVFNGKEIPSKRIRRDEIQADPKLDLTGIKSGEVDVYVLNPDGQKSNIIKFRIREKDPTPKLDRVLPFTLYLDEVAKTVAVYGQSFLKGAKLFIGNNEITGKLGTVVWKSDSYLEATNVDLTDKSKWPEGDIQAYVVNPNNKKSNTFKMTISYRVPSLSAIVPSAWNNKCDTDVEIQGLNFIPKAKVYFGSTIYTTSSTTHKLTYVSDKLLKFKLPASKLTAGTFQVYVENGTKAKSPKTPFVITAGSSLTPIPNYVRPQAGRAETKVQFYVSTNFSNRQERESLKPGSYLEVNGKRMATTCSQAGTQNYCYSLSGTLDLTGFKPGDYDMYIVNPCNIRSAKMTFSVLPADPSYITGFSPGYAKTGEKKKIKIKGTNFTKTHQLLWNGKVIPSVFISDKEIETRDAVDFSGVSPGSIKVQVKNGNGLTTPETRFDVIKSYTPVITSIASNVQDLSIGTSSMAISGSSFLVTSQVFFNGVRVQMRYRSATELVLLSADTSKLNAGVYYVQVKNGSRASNMYPVILRNNPPQIDYINPSARTAGTVSKLRLYMYGQRFSRTPKATVVVTDEQGKDLTKRWTEGTTSAIATYRYGDFDFSGLKAGRYAFQIKNSAKSISNKVYFTLSPPPPPIASRLNPAAVFRGVATQSVQVIGNNFVTGDLVIFNNNVLNRIPGTAKSNTTLEFTLNLSLLKRSGEYDVYVLRCLDAGCTKSQKTSVVKLKINDPPCALITCDSGLTPAKSESCDKTGGNVCRPVCTSDATCKTFDSKASWTCKSGFCK
jgi:hypothetical protein